MAARKVTIPTWTYFGVQTVSIQLNTFSDEDTDETIYNPVLNMWLEDGKKQKEGDEQVICIITEIYSECMHCAISEVFMGLDLIFNGAIINTCFVLDEDGEIIDEIDLDAFMKEYGPKEVEAENDMTVPETATVH